ncbi:MAG: nickel pincer cofactor biosynthesis protein LarB [Halobacteriaceae archaeon]
MDADSELDELLRDVAAGAVAPEDAADRLRDIGRVGEVARVDTRQGERTGIPEVVEAERKTTGDLIGIARELLAGAGLAILADVDADARRELSALDAVADAEFYDRSRTLVLRGADYEPPPDGGTVGVVTAGTSDVAVAEQAVALASEMGCAVETLYDVGVSGIRRLFDEVDTLEACDVLVVAAGREGALATVVAGLVSVPVIGLPVGTGTGLGGDGEAALLGMLQSCTYLTVVNVDAGFVAGGQAALVAR